MLKLIIITSQVMIQADFYNLSNLYDICIYLHQKFLAMNISLDFASIHPFGSL